MNKKYFTGALLVVTLMTGGIKAAEPNIYKDCGIGALIFSENNEINRSLASLSNIIWDLGTTASSSKSSGSCSREGNEVAAAIFIHSTYESVVEDTAKGSGDHLSAVLDLMKKSPESRSKTISSIQTKLAAKVSAPSYSRLTRLEKAEAYFNILDASI